MSHDDSEEIEKQEEKEANRQQARRRKIDDFLMRARADQNDRERRGQEERLDLERKAWDDAIAQIRSLSDGHEFDR